MKASIGNTFVAHTPFQLLMASHLVSSLSEFQSAENSLVVDMTCDDAIVKSANWRRSMLISPPLGGHIWGNGRRARCLVNDIVSWMQEYEEARLFLANLMWPLNNALYAVSLRRSNVILCNYPEGVGSLCPTYLDHRQKMRNRVKSVLGNLGGFPFHTVSCDMIGLGAARRVYSLAPDLIRSAVRGDLVVVPALSSTKAGETADECVFVGQNYADHMGKADFVPVCRKVGEFVLGTGYRRYYYKPHHAVNLRIEQELLTAMGFELLEDPRPMESLLIERLPTCVASYNSSVLVHARMMFGNRVRCIACHSETMLSHLRQRYDRNATLKNLYAKFGVEEWPVIDKTGRSRIRSVR